MKRNFKVLGMRCGHCRASITEAVAALDERAQVHVNLEAGEVLVDAPELTAKQIADAIEELGFEVTGPSTFEGDGR